MFRTHVTNHADDAHSRVIGTEQKLSANRILVREKLFSRGTADDNYFRLADLVFWRKVAAAEDRNRKRPEVARQNWAYRGERPVLDRQRLICRDTVSNGGCST